VSKKIQSIEILRFLAALMVVCIHLPTLGFAAGGWGVDLFFIVSGFVIMHSTHQGGHRFFRKRFIRIVPIYWICTLGLFVLALTAPALLKSTTANWSELIMSLLFIPFDKGGAGHFPVLAVGWSLNLEVFFYVIFGFAMMCCHSQRALVTSVVLVVVLLLARSFALPYPLAAYGNTMVLEFILGMVAFKFLEASERASSMSALLVLYCLPAAIGFVPLLDRAYAVGVPMWIFFIVTVSFCARVSFTPILTSLGGASYSLYLMHTYVIEGAVRIFPELGLSVAVDFAFTLIVLLVVVGLSLASFRYLERPMTLRLRELLVDHAHVARELGPGPADRPSRVRS
jgi:exopolysaccharide production protein ExoZ